MRKLPALFFFCMLLLLPAPVAAGGGSWLQTTEESYQPGEEVTAAGYTYGVLAEDEGPLVARLALIPHAEVQEGEPYPEIEVGPVIVETTGLFGYLTTRVVIGFRLPIELDPGIYSLSVRRANGAFFGDLIGANIAIGLSGGTNDFTYEWALDDPLLAELPDHARIVGPGFDSSVADLRAGRYPVGASMFLMDPSILEQPGVVTTTSTTTTLAPTTTTLVPTPNTLTTSTQVTSRTVVSTVASAPPLTAGPAPAAPDSVTFLVAVGALTVLTLAAAVAARRQLSPEVLLEETKVPERESVGSRD